MIKIHNVKQFMKTIPFLKNHLSMFTLLNNVDKGLDKI